MLKSSRQLLSQNDEDDNDEELDQDPEDHTAAEDEEEENVCEATIVARKYASDPTKCAAHVVHLAVKDWMRLAGRRCFVKDVVGKVKEARKLIRRIRTETCKIPYPRLANDTRWGSTYTMVR